MGTSRRYEPFFSSPDASPTRYFPPPHNQSPQTSSPPSPQQQQQESRDPNSTIIPQIQPSDDMTHTPPQSPAPVPFSLNSCNFPSCSNPHPRRTSPLSTCQLCEAPFCVSHILVHKRVLCKQIGSPRAHPSGPKLPQETIFIAPPQPSQPTPTSPHWNFAI